MSMIIHSVLAENKWQDYDWSVLLHNCILSSGFRWVGNPPVSNLLTQPQKPIHTHKTHTEPSGSCLHGGQIKYLFTLSGERLDRAPLILSLWEPLVPWITLSLGAPRQTSSHAPLRSMPRHRPHHPTANPRAPTLSDQPLHHGGGRRWRNPRHRVDVRDGAWREGGDGRRWRE